MSPASFTSNADQKAIRMSQVAAALDLGFFNARTFNKFDGRPVTDAQLQQVYDTMKWAPTAMNSQPAAMSVKTNANTSSARITHMERIHQTFSP